MTVEYSPDTSLRGDMALESALSLSPGNGMGRGKPGEDMEEAGLGGHGLGRHASCRLPTGLTGKILAPQAPVGLGRVLLPRITLGLCPTRGLLWMGASGYGRTAGKAGRSPGPLAGAGPRGATGGCEAAGLGSESLLGVCLLTMPVLQPNTLLSLTDPGLGITAGRPVSPGFWLLWLARILFLRGGQAQCVSILLDPPELTKACLFLAGL